MFDFKKNLISAIRVLSNGPDEQANYIRILFGIPNSEDDGNIDELALELEDAFFGADAELRALTINHDQYQNIKKLDDKLDKMSGKKNAHLWTIKALNVEKDWAEVRRLATTALASFEGEFRDGP